jgi:hypothetical protein
MRILLVVSDLFRSSGGVARYCRLLCKALGESPQVTVLDVIAYYIKNENQCKKYPVKNFLYRIFKN